MGHLQSDGHSILSHSYFTVGCKDESILCPLYTAMCLQSYVSNMCKETCGKCPTTKCNKGYANLPKCDKCSDGYHGYPTCKKSYNLVSGRISHTTDIVIHYH